MYVKFALRWCIYFFFTICFTKLCKRVWYYHRRELNSEHGTLDHNLTRYTIWTFLVSREPLATWYTSELHCTGLSLNLKIFFQFVFTRYLTKLWKSDWRTGIWTYKMCFHSLTRKIHIFYKEHSTPKRLPVKFASRCHLCFFIHSSFHKVLEKVIVRPWVGRGLYPHKMCFY